MSKLNSLLISLFVGVLAPHGDYNYVCADEIEQVPVIEFSSNTGSTADSNLSTEDTIVEDDFDRMMRESYEQENSSEYNISYKVETKPVIPPFKQESRTTQEKEFQPSHKGPFGIIFDVFGYNPILGILIVLVAAIFLNIRDYHKKLKK